jgi:hypothetical protein
VKRLVVVLVALALLLPAGVARADDGSESAVGTLSGVFLVCEVIPDQFCVRVVTSLSAHEGAGGARGHVSQQNRSLTGGFVLG